MLSKERILEHFEGKVVRKDLTKLVKGNAVVPTYVLEYLLGQHCASSDEEVVREGVEKVKEIIKKHFVHRDEAEIIKSRIKESGQHRIIDKVSVKLNDNKRIYEADFANLGLRNIPISAEIVTSHQKLLTSGVWCITMITFNEEEDKKPWVIDSLKPIQISQINVAEYIELRKHYSKDEWIDLLMQSIGLNPDQFNFRSKMIQVARMIPYCENNYNVIELGPKGTGKSHIYSEMSPHGMLISGGEVTLAKLFVNNGNGQIGLVGYWDNVAFDEFAGVSKRVDKNLVDTMKNYMANKSFSRGSSPYGAQASFSFVGNTMHSVSYMMKHTDLFEALPKAYYDTAFLDRIHCYLPGWEVQKLRNELFTDGYGFIVDYLAEILKELRKEDFSTKYRNWFELSEQITTRDRDGVLKTFSGFMKILYPDGNCTKAEAKEIFDFAMECRKRVKDQLAIMDETFNVVDFTYSEIESGETVTIKTLEEKQHPNLAKGPAASTEVVEAPGMAELVREEEPKTVAKTLSGKHLVVSENEKGISYEKLFGHYIEGASKITINDPYIRQFYQVKNLFEFLQMVMNHIPEGEEVSVHLVTKTDDFDSYESEERLKQLQESVENSGVNFTYEFNQSMSFHARSIETDTGWKISLDRGLDIFQAYDFKNPFNLANTVQEERLSKGFEVTFIQSR
jgi:ATP-dependent Lon protease